MPESRAPFDVLKSSLGGRDAREVLVALAFEGLTIVPLRKQERSMTEEQIKYMVDRFLGWKLPGNFSPDAGISYARPNYHSSVDATPSGTNLLDVTQADAMVRHMIEGMPTRFEPRDEQEAAERMDNGRNTGGGKMHR